MKKLSIFIIVFCFSHILTAQNSFLYQSNKEDNINDTIPEIIKEIQPEQDEILTKMINMHIENNIRKNGYDGYRVEIFSSASYDARNRASDVKKEFLSDYPDIDINIEYVAPDFKVRVGEFRIRSEALKLQKELISKYPNAFITKDIIGYSEPISME